MASAGLHIALALGRTKQLWVWYSLLDSTGEIASAGPKARLRGLQKMRRGAAGARIQPPPGSKHKPVAVETF